MVGDALGLYVSQKVQFGPKLLLHESAVFFFRKFSAKRLTLTVDCTNMASKQPNQHQSSTMSTETSMLAKTVPQYHTTD